MAGRGKADVSTEVHIIQSVPDETRTFSKEQIVASARYQNRRDLVEALLEDKNYTMEAVDKLMDGFLKGQVK